MRKNYVIKAGWPLFAAVLTFALFSGCTNDQDDLDACNCNFYPEINQYLPNSLTADDVIGEDTYYSGKELRALNEKCLQFCE